MTKLLGIGLLALCLGLTVAQYAAGECDHWVAEHLDTGMFASGGQHSGGHSSHENTTVYSAPIHDVSAKAEVWSDIENQDAASAWAHARQTHQFRVKWDPGSCQQEHGNRPTYTVICDFGYNWSQHAEDHAAGCTWRNAVLCMGGGAHPPGDGWQSDDPDDWPYLSHPPHDADLEEGESKTWSSEPQTLDDEWGAPCAVRACALAHKTVRGESRANASSHAQWRKATQ
jgi:hypothetical protein